MNEQPRRQQPAHVEGEYGPVATAGTSHPSAIPHPSAPGDVLRDLVAEHGPGLCHEPRRVVALLKDLCPGYRREVAVLSHALDERIPVDLIARAEGAPLPSLLAMLAGRLHDHQGTDRALARWAVETWAVALGLVALPTLSLSSLAPAGNVVTSDGKTHLSIIGALAGMPLGGSVLVRRGRYTEPLVLHGPLILAADGPGAVVLAAAGAPCLTVTGGDVLVRGFTVRGESAEAAVLVTGGTLVLEACDISGGPGDCVRAVGAHAAVRIHHCRLHDSATAGIDAGVEAHVTATDVIITAAGVAGVEASAGATVMLERCTIEDGNGNGLFVTDGADARMERCTITRHTFAGIEGQAGGQMTLRGCTVQDGLSTGIRLLGRSQALAEDTRVLRNGLAGIDVEAGARLTLIGGRVHGGSRSGVRAGSLGEIRLEGVQITANAGDGLDVDEDGYLESSHCTITGNARAAVRASAGASGLIEQCIVSNNALGAWDIDAESDVVLAGNRE